MVIDLVLGKGLSSQHTPVPRLTGCTLEKARNAVLGSSLNLGAYVFDSSVVTGTDSLNAFVYKQNPDYHPDASVQLGSAVYIWLTVDTLKLQSDTTSVIANDTADVGGANQSEL